MSDCDCDKMKAHSENILEALKVMQDLKAEQTTPRVAMLMRMVGNEVKKATPEAKRALRKELIQVVAASLIHLEQLGQ